MSSYDDRDTAITRDPMQGQGYQPLPPQQYYGYPQYGRRFGGGYGMGMGMGRGMGMHRGGGGWSETKPFFMTSEFLATVLTVIGIAVTAAFAADLDSRGSSLLITILVAAYTVSRGIAKAGTRSRANDFRDEMNVGSHDGQHQHQHEHVG